MAVQDASNFCFSVDIGFCKGVPIYLTSLCDESDGIGRSDKEAMRDVCKHTVKRKREGFRRIVSPKMGEVSMKMRVQHIGN
jgi:hypothetical protein